LASARSRSPGGFKSYTDHDNQLNHSAATNPWVRDRVKGRANALGSDEAKAIARAVATHERRLAPTRVWQRASSDADCAYERAARWEGARAGMCFKLSAQGLGYYADDAKWVDVGETSGELAPAAVLARPRVFLDLAAGGRSLGRVVLTLWADEAPAAASDFLKLATAGLGASLNARNPSKLHYRGTRLSRLLKGVAAYAGDELDDADEVLAAAGEIGPSEAALRHTRHSRAGLLSTDGLARTARFVITLGAAPQFDGRRRVFGEVSSGFETLRELERVPTDAAGAPAGGGVRIVECGLVSEAPALATSGATAAATLDAAGALARGDDAVLRVGHALTEGLARASSGTAPAEGVLTDALAGQKRGRARADAARDGRAGAVAARWDALGTLSADDSDDSEAAAE
jgi:cyclophilin family peptidyl-prolyl cis-trans isomerase